MTASRALLCAVGTVLLVSGDCVLEIKRLHADLLAGYNRQARPVRNESSTVNLRFGVGLIDFTMDPVSDIMDSLIWVRATWEDEYLRWEPDEYGELFMSWFNPKDIWTPDICLYNVWAKSCHVLSEDNGNALVRPDGAVLWMPHAWLINRCDVDRTNWPRDEVVCVLKFSSWTLDGDHLNMSLYEDEHSGADTEDMLESRKREVVNFTVERTTHHIDGDPFSYPSLVFTLTTRRNEHRTAELAVPVVCSSVLMLLSFLIPVQSPQKLTFCWVSVLITIIGLINLFGRMPADAHGTASIASFYVAFTVLLLVFTLLEVLVVLLSRPRSTPLPRCLRGCLSGLVGKLLCLDTPLFHDYSHEEEDVGKTYEWALLAGAADRLCGLAFLLIVAVSVPPNITWA